MVVNRIKKFIKREVYKHVEKRMQERWDSCYGPLIASSEATEANCRQQVKEFLENAEIRPLLSVIRQELTKIAKDEIKTLETSTGPSRPSSR